VVVLYWWQVDDLVPAFGFFIWLVPTHQAQGYNLALLVLPLVFPGAARTYYKQGYVDLRIAALMLFGYGGC